MKYDFVETKHILKQEGYEQNNPKIDNQPCVTSFVLRYFSESPLISRSRYFYVSNLFLIQILCKSMKMIGEMFYMTIYATLVRKQNNSRILCNHHQPNYFHIYFDINIAILRTLQFSQNYSSCNLERYRIGIELSKRSFPPFRY